MKQVGYEINAYFLDYSGNVVKGMDQTTTAVSNISWQQLSSHAQERCDQNENYSL